MSNTDNSKDKKHEQNSQTNGNASLTDNWYVTEGLNKPTGAYLRREANIFDPLFCGEEAFSKIQNEIVGATKSVDIVCWGFDPAMPLLRSAPPAEEWPYWSEGEETNIINKEAIVEAAKNKLMLLSKEEMENKQKQKNAVVVAEEVEKKEEKAKEATEEEGAPAPKPTKLPEPVVKAVERSGFIGKAKTLGIKEARKVIEKSIGKIEAQIKKLSGMVKQCDEYLQKGAKEVEAHIYGLIGLDEAYSMVRGTKILGNETLGQLLIGTATTTSNSAEYAVLGEIIRACEIEVKKKGDVDFTTEFFLTVYAERMGTFNGIVEAQEAEKRAEIGQKAVNAMLKIGADFVQKAKEAEKNQPSQKNATKDTKKEGEESAKEGENAQKEGEEETSPEIPGVKVRVLMWYGGWLATLGSENAPGFLKSKVTNVVKKVLTDELDKVLNTKVNTFLDKQKNDIVKSLFEGKSWPKASEKVTTVLGKVLTAKEGKYKELFGTKIDDLTETTTTELGDFATAVTELLDNGSKGLKDIAKVAGSAGVKCLIEGFTKTAYSPRSYYNQAWFTAAALGKIPNLEMRIRQFDPLLPQQLFGIIMPPKDQPESEWTERMAVSTFRSHHQKTISVDYVTPEDARGFVMSHNLNSRYWDTRAHLNDVNLGFREPNASTDEPWQDLSCFVQGSCLHDVNKNFCDAWDKAKPTDAAGWQSELLSWLPMLSNPKKYLNGKLDEIGAAIVKHLETKTKNSALNEIKEDHKRRMKGHLTLKNWSFIKILEEDLPSLVGSNLKEVQNILTGLSTPAGPAPSYEAGSLMKERKEITADILAEKLVEKNPDVKRTGQIVRTYPVGVDDTGDQDDSIKLAYYEKIIQRPRAFVYAENQYFQLAEWAQKLNESRLKYKNDMLEKGNTSETLPLYIFGVTPIQEKSGMIKRHHAMLKEWGVNKQLTAADKKSDDSEVPGEKEAAEEVKANNADEGADLPKMSKKETEREDGEEMGKPEDKGANPVEVQVCMLKAVNRNTKRTDIGGLLSKLGGFGESLDELWQGTIKGYDTRSIFTDEEIEDCQNKFDTGNDLDFWQKTIHPSRYYTNIYVHSKLTVIDDAIFTTGSANLNNRSMAGDSELNLLSDDTQTAFKFRHTVIEDHTRNWSVDPLTEDSLENNLKEADKKGTLEEDSKCQRNSVCMQKIEANFPQMKVPNNKTLEGIKKTKLTWVGLSKDNEKTMMEGAMRANEQNEVVETDHKGILNCHLCRLVDQRSPSLITVA